MSFFKPNTVMGKLLSDIKLCVKDFNQTHPYSKYHVSQWKVRNDFSGNKRIAWAIHRGARPRHFKDLTSEDIIFLTFFNQARDYKGSELYKRIMMVRNNIEVEIV